MRSRAARQVCRRRERFSAALSSEKGDDGTSNAIIAAFTGDAAFEAFAKAEMDDILKRDAEDDDKLAAGIAMAVKKGARGKTTVEALRKVDVLGKSADTVAEIISALGDAPSEVRPGPQGTERHGQGHDRE